MRKNSTKCKIGVAFLITATLVIISQYGVECYSNSQKIETAKITYKLAAEMRKYYYNQLSIEEKEIYNCLDSSKQKIMKNEKICIATIRNKRRQDAINTANKIVQRAITAYRLDNPLSTLWFNRYKARILGDTQYIYASDFHIILYPQRERYYDFRNQKELEKAIQSVKQKTIKFVKTLSGTTEEKYVKIYNWLLQDSKYGDTIKNPNVSDLYGAIIKKNCICGGFSYAFKYVADMANLPVVSVIGKIKKDGTMIQHAWNMLFLENDWLLVDLISGLEQEPKKDFLKIHLDNTAYYPEIFTIPQ